MTVHWNVILLMSLVMGILQTGSAIKCYRCTEYTGDVSGLGGSVNTVPCLNKESVECSKDTKVCMRTTTIQSKPHSYELNYQDCGERLGPGAIMTCSRSQSWTDDGLKSDKSSTCFCAGDNCNAAGTIRKIPVLALSVMSGAFYLMNSRM